jgi:hypothetical protein
MATAKFPKMLEGLQHTMQLNPNPTLIWKTTKTHKSDKNYTMMFSIKKLHMGMK